MEFIIVKVQLVQKVTHAKNALNNIIMKNIYDTYTILNLEEYDNFCHGQYM